MTELLRIAQVALGIGLVIFVHELGHYIAARLCGVRVETFSLGFGPRLFGWRRGRTLYQLALVPLGGYCRMAGEERRQDGLPPADDELPAKSVGARFLIYSGGVLMNVAFGLVVFPILFHVGVPFIRPVLGEPYPGSPAWHARVPEGLEVLSVNGHQVLDFYDIPSEVALGRPDETELRLRDPRSGEERRISLVPVYEPELGTASIGVTPDLERDASGAITLDVQPDTPAARAGLASGDRLVRVVDGAPGLGVLQQMAIQTRAGGDLVLEVAGDAGTRVVRVTPETSEELFPPRIGIHPPPNHLADVREGPQTRELDLRPDDRLLSVQGVPLQEREDLPRALLDHPGPLEIRVRRGQLDLTVEGPALDRAAALSLVSDLHLVADVESNRIVVNPGEPAALAGLQSGDRVLRVDGTPVESWSDVSDLVRIAGREGRPARLSVQRPSDDPAVGALHREIEVTPEALPIPIYGVAPLRAGYVYSTSSFGEALRLGAARSWKFLEDSWLTLKRIVQGRVSTKQSVGGIITIGVVSYNVAESGLSKFFFFLCIVSINLAFINVLPIPVLDGGHLFFLIVEKIKGSPVSERVLSYSQLVGVVLILSLMVYVTYNDLVRWVFQP